MPSSRALSDYSALSIADLQDIQAGPVVPIPTKNIIFLFFTITDTTSFRERFKEHVFPSITTSDDARKLRSTATAYRARVGELQTLAGINVAFSKAGLDLFLESGNIGDAPFEAGQLEGAETVLGDDLSNWLPYFKDSKIHGLIEVTGHPLEHVQQVMTDGVTKPLGDSITVIFEHVGSVRPDPLGKHEHFGFSDGISQPFVHFEDDLDRKREPLPGQTEINPGVLILGQMADPKKDERPEWSKNGSILVYRHLKQRVPEWNKFLEDVVRDSIFFPRTTTDTEFPKMVDFLGARLMGRWKSGTSFIAIWDEEVEILPAGLPVVLTPYEEGKPCPEDHPPTGKDEKKNNDFDYGPRSDSNPPTPREQFLCPFAAHVRKTGPRTDIAKYRVEETAISRRGIAYGIELTDTELTEKITREERGLSFVCFQSSMELGMKPVEGESKRVGFPFIQEGWSNKITFPENTADDVVPGFDPIIGQKKGSDRSRGMTGYDATGTNKTLKMPEEFVVAQGGEYFFLPSITALKIFVEPK